MSKIKILSFILVTLALYGCDSRAILETRRTNTVEVEETSTPSSTASDLGVNQIQLSQMNLTEWVSTSPSGRWVSTGLVALPKPGSTNDLFYSRVIIFDVKNNARWVVIDEWKQLGLGFPIPEPLEWSSDEAFFYFSNRVTPDGCAAFSRLSGLFGVNLKNGELEEILAFGSTAWVALSPNEESLVYAAGDDLVIKDLETGEENQVLIDPGKNYEVGNLLWSPNGNYVTLTLAIEPCSGEYGISKTIWAESSTILVVDSVTFETKTILEEDPRLFITWEWVEDDEITLRDGLEGAMWKVDISTWELNKE